LTIFLLEKDVEKFDNVPNTQWSKHPLGQNVEKISNQKYKFN
jgi:hypothetical protein